MPSDRPTRRGALHRALPALLVACLAGCAGEGESTGGGGPTGDFATIQSEIFDQRCVQAACHDAATRQGGLDLSAPVSYANLVGVAPENAVARESGQLRVTAGSPEESFLLHKITGDLQPGEGSPMPLVGSPLSPSEIELVRSWIAAGAPQD